VDRSKRQVASICHVSLVYLFSVAFSLDGSAINTLTASDENAAAMGI